MNNTPKEVPSQAVALSIQAENMLSIAREVKITSVVEYQGAASQLKTIKAKAKELEETRKGITSPMDEAKKRVMDFFRAPLQFLSDAEQIIKRGMIAYDLEQEKKRREEEALLRELARKEQERLEKAADKKATKAEGKGEIEKADEIRNNVPIIPMPILPAGTPKISGITKRTVWSGTVIDKMALIRAVAAGQAPASLLDINTTVLNQMARALRGEMAYPGVKAVETQQIAV